ncbi:hypothetical protein BC629DRAFT_1579594 [Irpex lacteus]|nr:hypothetical protein BC629DRAFT_1579594 [Irpex lacteus]
MIALCRASTTIVQLRPENEKKKKSSAVFDSQADISLPNLQRAIHGHIIIHPQHPEHIPDVLPPSIEDIVKPICVIFVGSRPPTRQWLLQKAKPLVVNPQRVLAALVWLKANNPLYSSIVINHAALDSIPSDVPPSSAQDSLTDRYDAIPSLSNLDSLRSENSDIVITDIDGSAPSNELRAAALRHVKQKGGEYVQLPHEALPANEFFDPSLFPKTFPTLFPYGCGGLEDLSREVSVSLKHHARHLFLSVVALRTTGRLPTLLFYQRMKNVHYV